MIIAPRNRPLAATECVAAVSLAITSAALLGTIVLLAVVLAARDEPVPVFAVLAGGIPVWAFINRAAGEHGRLAWQLLRYPEHDPTTTKGNVK